MAVLIKFCATAQRCKCVYFHRAQKCRTTTVLIPTVIPMGWNGAPKVGQSMSWATVLYRERDEDDLGCTG